MNTWAFGETVFETKEGSRLDLLCKELSEEFPDLKMGHKRDLWWHWIAHVLIVIFTVGLNRTYISGYTTTSKNRVDWSDKRWEQLHRGSDYDHDIVWVTLRHEREHLRQFRDKGTFVMVVIWLFPPVLFCYGRAIVIERPGYIESLRGFWVVNRQWAESSEYRDGWIKKFTGPSYGWMWVIKGQVAKWFDDELKRLRQGG